MDILKLQKMTQAYRRINTPDFENKMFDYLRERIINQIETRLTQGEFLDEHDTGLIERILRPLNIINQEHACQWFRELARDQRRPHSGPLNPPQLVLNAEQIRGVWTLKGHADGCEFLPKTLIADILKHAERTTRQHVIINAESNFPTSHVISQWLEKYLNESKERFRDYMPTYIRNANRARAPEPMVGGGGGGVTRVYTTGGGHGPRIHTYSASMGHQYINLSDLPIPTLSPATATTTTTITYTTHQAVNPPSPPTPMRTKTALHKKFLDMLAKTEGLGTCPVCLDDLTAEETIVPDCSHLICNACCARVNKCPICRGKI